MLAERRVGTLDELKGPVFRVRFPETTATGKPVIAIRDYSYIPPSAEDAMKDAGIPKFVYPCVYANEHSPKVSYQGPKIITSRPIPMDVFLEKEVEVDLLFDLLAYESAWTYLKHLKDCTAINHISNKIPRSRWHMVGAKKDLDTFPNFFGRDMSAEKYERRVKDFLDKADSIQKHLESYSKWREGGKRPRPRNPK